MKISVAAHPVTFAPQAVGDLIELIARLCEIAVIARASGVAAKFLGALS